MSEETERHGVRVIMEDFINIYKSEPCLWQIKNKDYHHRDKKNAAYNKLIEEYRKLEPNANRDAVVKKLNAIRTNYRKEKRKVEESTRSGAGTSDVYKPTLWYYELLQFLDNDQGTPRLSRTNIDEIESSEETESALNLQDIHDSSSENSDFTSQQTSSRARPPKRKTTDATDLSNEVLHSVNEHFKRPLLKDDRFDIFGKNVAIKLRELPKQQRLIAEKIINDTLFQAEMGNLTLPQNELIRAAPTPSPPSHHTQQYNRVTPTPNPPPHQTQQYNRVTPTPSPPPHHTQQYIRVTPTPSPPSNHSQQYNHLTPTPSPTPHHTQQYIRVTPTPSPPPRHTQQYIHATAIYEPQQLINLESTPSLSTPIPDNHQEYDDTSSSHYNNLDSQHSTEDTAVLLSFTDHSVGTYLSNFDAI